ncbi:MAG: flagellar hook-basal body complex protein, partial [Pseudomonadota bacterium]
MSFSTAISGINAANAELGVISNNIANASTTGFKSSRTEFADVYANSLLGAGENAIGQGVGVAAVTQQFSQGNITFTNNSLDLAINGAGFFPVSADG